MWEIHYFQTKKILKVEELSEGAKRRVEELIEKYFLKNSFILELKRPA